MSGVSVVLWTLGLSVVARIGWALGGAILDRLGRLSRHSVSFRRLVRRKPVDR